MTYFLTPGLDAPDMVHLDPDDETRCGQREGGTGTLDGDDIVYERISHQRAYALLRKNLAIPCRRCLVPKKGLTPIVPHSLLISEPAAG